MEQLCKLAKMQLQVLDEVLLTDYNSEPTCQEQSNIKIVGITGSHASDMAKKEDISVTDQIS